MASLLPDFEYDIFISYRQNDNRAGWVTEFVKALQEELAAAIKEPVSVYFDSNPHDGLLETHDVDKSLQGKLKCIMLIPILSQTYADPKSFAWNQEFVAFNNLAKEDRIGRDVRLRNGNVASRILPVRIHNLDTDDLRSIESELRSVLRPVDFIFSSPGVNRPLRFNEEQPRENLNKTYYLDQINKVANAVKEIIIAVKGSPATVPVQPAVKPVRRIKPRIRQAAIASFLLIVTYLIAYFFYARYSMNKLESPSKSVAVLPFENLSGDPSQEYLGDGIADQILNALVQLKDLKVPGRTSSFSFKNKGLELAEIGSRLKVANVLTGSVLKQGNRIKVFAQLQDVKDGYVRWSQQFEESLDNLFAIQEQIAVTVTIKLKIVLLQNEKIEIGEGLTRNKDAYDAYLKGYHFWRLRQLRESEKYFKQAIGLDSTFAPAYAGLAETYLMFAFFHFASPEASMPLAQQYAEKAIRLDSALGRPYLVLGFKNYKYDLNYDISEKYFAKCLTLIPKDPQTHYWYGQFLIFAKIDFKNALAHMREAVKLDPLGSIPNFNLGMALNYNQQYHEAEEVLKLSAELNPKNEYAFFNTGVNYLEVGKWKESLAAFEKASQLRNDRSTAFLVFMYMKDKNYPKARAVYEDLVKSAQDTSGYTSLLSVASAAYFVGEKKKAFEFLRQALATHDIWIELPQSYRPQVPGDLMEDPISIGLFNAHFDRLNQKRKKTKG